jgi:hypothetical protein
MHRIATVQQVMDESLILADGRIFAMVREGGWQCFFCLIWLQGACEPAEDDQRMKGLPLCHVGGGSVIFSRDRTAAAVPVKETVARRSLV